jgi:hypothetical protein
MESKSRPESDEKIKYANSGRQIYSSGNFPIRFHDQSARYAEKPKAKSRQTTK